MWALLAACLLQTAGGVGNGNAVAASADGEPAAPEAAEGYRLLRTKAYLPADLDQEIFDALPQVWEEPLRSRASEATPAERRLMAMERYGLTPDPKDSSR